MTADGADVQPEITIRSASPADAAAIAAVHVASWRETYVGLLSGEMLRDLSIDDRTKRWSRILDQASEAANTAVFVAERNGRVVGFASGGAQRDQSLLEQGLTGEITAIYVLKEAQRLGVGRGLMTAIASALADGGHRSASLWVLRDNQPARSFYRSLGGSVAAGREDSHDGAVLVELAYAWRDLSASIVSPRQRASRHCD